MEVTKFKIQNYVINIGDNMKMKKPDNSVRDIMKKIFLRSKKKQPQKQEEEHIP